MYVIQICTPWMGTYLPTLTMHTTLVLHATHNMYKKKHWSYLRSITCPGSKSIGNPPRICYGVHHNYNMELSYDESWVQGRSQEFLLLSPTESVLNVTIEFKSFIQDCPQSKGFNSTQFPKSHHGSFLPLEESLELLIHRRFSTNWIVSILTNKKTIVQLTCSRYDLPIHHTTTSIRQWTSTR